ncbi:Serine proteases, trypsin family, serine active site,Peptidase S1, PA clan,Serine proteases, trypsin [Cinara cedri]|uniref:Serine proteases, trypsin family, serine active site,Peptidase S1, PA clan,Serine proteases, trypsin n=1 Tax=Cinara cedri TaxID=506608 RepID=A0A5E4N5K2_9HEMI|nr:Serine proteases, trypsin family, serine active site,Peptidase S1, PA clan,Serine proteases, trypsin [Cinara cedri]
MYFNRYPVMRKRIFRCLIIFAYFVDSQSLDPKDNELCKVLTKTSYDYECKPIDQCPTVLQAIKNLTEYPRICRFRGRTPIVCCPTYQDSLSQKSDAKCREYYALTTKGGGTINSGGCRTKIVSEKSILTIVGGTEAEASEFPHMVLLGFGENINDVEWACGGSLISDRYILSAAHCSKIKKKGPVKWVLLGDHNLEMDDQKQDTQIVEIVRSILHPDYKPPSVYNDIGLYQLNAPVQFNQFILPICLNTAEIQLDIEEAVAIGWGRTGSASSTSKVLMKVSLDLVEQNECNRSYSLTMGKKLAFGIDPNSQICAGKINGGKDTCQGDSGGPLQIVHPEFECMYTQVGITSFGKLCGQPNAPGVYSRVSNYVSWINSIVWP